MSDRLVDRARRSSHAALPPATRTVLVRGAAVRVAELGTAEDASTSPLVLVAGLAGSGETWCRVAPALAAAGRRVVLVDLPGFGALGGHRRLLPIPQQAEWLAALLDAGEWGLPGGPGAAGGVDVVGYSLGGSVAARVAAARPELVRRLVLVAPAGVPSQRGQLPDFASLLHMAWLAGPSFWPNLARDARRAGLRSIVAAAREVRLDDATALLPRIVAPTLILRGDRDTLVPRGDVERIAALVPGARLETLPHTGHGSMAECPGALAAAILAFVA